MESIPQGMPARRYTQNPGIPGFCLGKTLEINPENHRVFSGFTGYFWVFWDFFKSLNVVNEESLYIKLVPLTTNIKTPNITNNINIVDSHIKII